MVLEGEGCEITLSAVSLVAGTALLRPWNHPNKDGVVAALPNLHRPEGNFSEDQRVQSVCLIKPGYVAVNLSPASARVGQRQDGRGCDMSCKEALLVLPGLLAKHC